MTPVIGTNPYVGFSPTIPHQHDGSLTDPPLSVPNAMSTSPMATCK